MKKSISVWLYVGVFMIFIQIVIGGITRLTGSGLSITRWDIITGTLPPLNTADWENAFKLYQATPQYLLINNGMSLSEFKFIFFWEYIHRLWARLMGFIFLIPFVYFLYQKYFSSDLLKRLFIVFLTAGLTASFGWIMVVSGLGQQPWVSPYKLSLHLSIALFLFAFLLSTALNYSFTKPVNSSASPPYFFLAQFILGLLAFQLFLGGLMSGMKAGLFYPTWPLMNEELLPKVLYDFQNWNIKYFYADQKHILPAAIVQFLHRNTAYFIALFTFYFYYKAKRHYPLPFLLLGLPFITTLQITIGIITVLHCTTQIPLFLGVLHQATAVILLANWVAVLFFFRHSNSSEKKK